MSRSRVGRGQSWAGLSNLGAFIWKVGGRSSEVLLDWSGGMAGPGAWSATKPRLAPAAPASHPAVPLPYAILLTSMHPPCSKHGIMIYSYCVPGAVAVVLKDWRIRRLWLQQAVVVIVPRVKGRGAGVLPAWVCSCAAIGLQQCQHTHTV